MKRRFNARLRKKLSLRLTVALRKKPTHKKRRGSIFKASDLRAGGSVEWVGLRSVSKQHEDYTKISKTCRTTNFLNQICRIYRKRYTESIVQ